MPKSNLQISNLSPRLQAYTLIEILVVMTIAAVLFLAGSASYREFSRRQELASVVRQIKGDIRLAQELAIAGKKPLASGCNTLDGYFFVVDPPSSYEILSKCIGGDRVEKAVDLPSGITLSGLSPDLPDSNQILFKSLGQGTNIPAGTTTSITVIQASYGNTAQITVTDGGEIR